MTLNISLSDWYVTVDGVQSTEFTPGQAETYIVLEYPLFDYPGKRHLHAVPISGIAFRMEMSGIRDPQQILEHMIVEMNHPEFPDSVYPQLVDVYYSTATAIARELYQVQGPHPLLGEEGFLLQVRSLLKGEENTTPGLPEVESCSPLALKRREVVRELVSRRETVSIDRSNSYVELMHQIEDFSKGIEMLSDYHCHLALDEGALFYARKTR